MGRVINRGWGLITVGHVAASARIGGVAGERCEALLPRAELRLPHHPRGLEPCDANLGARGGGQGGLGGEAGRGRGQRVVVVGHCGVGGGSAFVFPFFFSPHQARRDGTLAAAYSARRPAGSRRLSRMLAARCACRAHRRGRTRSGGTPPPTSDRKGPT